MTSRLAKLGMLVVAGVEVIGCGAQGKPETTPRAGETIEHTDAGVKIKADLRKVQIRTIRKIRTICGTRQAIKETKRYDCPEFIKEYSDPENKRQRCIDCAHEVEVIQ